MANPARQSLQLFFSPSSEQVGRDVDCWPVFLKTKWRLSRNEKETHHALLA